MYVSLFIIGREQLLYYGLPICLILWNVAGSACLESPFVLKDPLLDKVTDIDCFDFNNDGIKDIAVIGTSGSETKVLLYESTSEYQYDVFSEWSDVGNDIRESLDDDFSMVILKNILDRVICIKDAALEESSIPAKVLESEVTTFNSYDELIEDIKMMIEMEESSDSDTWAIFTMRKPDTIRMCR